METTREANTWGFGLSYDMHAKNESALAWQNKLFGPTANSTLLEFLEEHSVKATFFVCGFNYVYFNPQWRALVKEIHNRGHEIGCHTIGHVESNTLSEEHGYGNDKGSEHLGIRPVIRHAR